VPSLPRLTSQWPQPWLFAYHERAAIKEYDGRMERPRAEREAEQEVREMAAREDRCSK
jgi:hypothetical protein